MRLSSDGVDALLIRFERWLRSTGLAREICSAIDRAVRSIPEVIAAIDAKETRILEHRGHALPRKLQFGEPLGPGVIVHSRGDLLGLKQIAIARDPQSIGAADIFLALEAVCCARE